MTLDVEIYFGEIDRDDCAVPREENTFAFKPYVNPKLQENVVRRAVLVKQDEQIYIGIDRDFLLPNPRMEERALTWEAFTLDYLISMEIE